LIASSKQESTAKAVLLEIRRTTCVRVKAFDQTLEEKVVTHSDRSDLPLSRHLDPAILTCKKANLAGLHQAGSGPKGLIIGKTK
jgi:hypothetical protein